MVVHAIDKPIAASECCNEQLILATYVYECSIIKGASSYTVFTHGPGAPYRGANDFENSTAGVIRVIKEDTRSTIALCGTIRGNHWIYVCDSCMRRLGVIW